MECSYWYQSGLIENDTLREQTPCFCYIKSSAESDVKHHQSIKGSCNRITKHWLYHIEGFELTCRKINQLFTQDDKILPNKCILQLNRVLYDHETCVLL